MSKAQKAQKIELKVWTLLSFLCSYITTQKYILEDTDKLSKIVLFITVTNVQQHRINLLFFSNQCSYKAKWKSPLKGHVGMQHECVIYNCNQYNYKGKTKGHVKQHVAKRCEVFFIIATSVVTHSNGKLILKVMQKCNMKVLFITVTNVNKTKGHVKQHVATQHEGVLYNCKHYIY